MTAEELIAFERRVADAFQRQEIRGPIHLSGGNEQDLIEVFVEIDKGDWVFSNYRSHYHALLHGVDQDWLYKEILEGRSMGIQCPKRRFYSSAIVGGHIPIAVGVAAALKRMGNSLKVWCFLGDMAYTTGAYHEAHRYACGHKLPITFVIEDNGFSCDTPTSDTWGEDFTHNKNELYYHYARTYPHSGIGAYVF
jgi:pyruvate dehydrogenase E1 component alpha subunit